MPFIEVYNIKKIEAENISSRNVLQIYLQYLQHEKQILQ